MSLSVSVKAIVTSDKAQASEWKIKILGNFNLMDSQYIETFLKWLVVMLVNMTFLYCVMTCQHLKIYLAQWTNIFQWTIHDRTKSFTDIRLFKVKDRPMNVHVTEYEKFIDTVSELHSN